MEKDRITEANNQGQGDRVKDDNTPSTSAGFVASLLSFGFLGDTVHYNPPADPEEREAYDAGYKNNH